MDDFDRLQAEEEKINKRLISESTSLENARNAYKVRTKTFEGDTATKEQIINEMQATYARCTEIRI